MNTIMARIASAAVIAAALLIVPAVSLPVPQLAVPLVHANGTCGTTSGSGYDDGWDGNNNTWGSYAVIQTRAASFCTTGPAVDDAIAASTLAVDNNVVSGCQCGNFMQVGYYKQPNWASYNMFVGYTAVGCAGPNNFCMDGDPNWIPGSGNTHAYNVDYQFSSGMWREVASIDSTFLIGTPYDPANTGSGRNYWPGPWREQDFGESHNSGDDVPGSINFPAAFSNVAYYPTAASASPLTSHTEVYDFCYYHRKTIDSADFNIWVSSC